MSAVVYFLSGDAALLALAAVGALAARRPYGSNLIYAIAFAISTAMLIGAGVQLLGGTKGDAIVLPLGLPWIGAHFRVDALSAFFLVVIDLGGAAASLYGLGDARHEHSPGRVLPFFPAFLAGMNLVLVADDAYAFLLSWEFMSIASWALVMAHHRDGDNARAGYVYLVMAGFGTFMLLLAFALLADSCRQLCFRRHARSRADAGRGWPRLHAGPGRRGVEGGDRAAARLAAARPPCRAEPRVRADERGHDEGRGLRVRPDRVRPGGTAGAGGGACRS